MFNMVVDFFQHFGLEMCVDGREKTVYTHNLDSTNNNIIYKNTPLTVLKPNESYKYLGV